MQNTKRNLQTDVAVIGAGPAGLSAAVFAARSGHSVIALDRMPSPGRKLLASGGGRCNLANALETSALCASFGEAAKFVRPALTSFPLSSLLRFFSSLGVECSAPDGFHYFPDSNSAREVLDALIGECRELQIQILPNAEVLEICRDAAGYMLFCEELTILCRKVVISTGGKSWPSLGSNGGGFRLAASLGHSIVKPVPALGGLAVAQPWLGTLAGVVLQSAAIRIRGESKNLARGGELLFTHSGLSGPAALNACARISRALEAGEPVEIEADLLPALSWQRLSEILIEQAALSGKRNVTTLLGELLPASLVTQLAATFGFRNAVLANLSKAMRDSVVKSVKALSLTVTGTEGFDKAMVTSGGVRLDEVNHKTLESKLHPGLHFAGEVLDVDGPCGGFNLHWAFASGRLAGMSASASLM
ncbi:MAG: NAD(P)/FAD-dependent oxidoreductase [Planctomycetota bacterium]